MPAARKKKTKAEPAPPSREEQIQQHINDWVHRYGKSIRSWPDIAGLTHSAGIEIKDVTDERLAVARMAEEAADERLRQGIREGNKKSRLRAVLVGDSDPELSSITVSVSPQLSTEEEDVMATATATVKTKGTKSASKNKKAAKPVATNGKVTKNSVIFEALEGTSVKKPLASEFILEALKEAGFADARVDWCISNAKQALKNSDKEIVKLGDAYFIQKRK